MEEDLIKFSIIIPYYNGEKYISTCLDSLLNQDLRKDEYEIIVVDDGSTHSLEILNYYASNHQNIKYVRQNNAHHSAARNHGLRIARGEYLFFCDCDDYIATRVLGRLYNIAKYNQADILRFKIKRGNEGENFQEKIPEKNWESIKIYESGTKYISAPEESLRSGPWEFFVNRILLIKNKIKFDDSMIMREDRKFFTEMIFKADRVISIDVTTYYYVQHPTSICHLLGKKKLNTLFVDNMLSYTNYMRQTFERVKNSKISDECARKVNELISEEVFIILHNTFRYGTLSRNREVMQRIGTMHVYPIKIKISKYKWLIFLMNRPRIWYSLCVLFHIIPASIRHKFF